MTPKHGNSLHTLPEKDLLLFNTVTLHSQISFLPLGIAPFLNVLMLFYYKFLQV